MWISSNLARLGNALAIIKNVLYSLRAGVNSRLQPVLYIVEPVDWSIKWDGKYISENVSNLGLKCFISTTCRFFRGGIVHFGCLDLAVRGTKKALRSNNKVIATFFHGDFGISQELDDEINRFIDLVPSLSGIVVSNRIMMHRLLSWGVPIQKINLIPIGVDLEHFRPQSTEQNVFLRKRWGIPEGAICIGSFQKDGEGWPDGSNPKLIKGPDLFVDVVFELSKNYPIHCFLTGPSRGYVIQALSERDVAFTHHYLEDYLDIAACYACLDLYLITSREEGGPKAVLEAKACGVPIVSTSVGMVPDVITSPEIISNNVEGLVNACILVLDNLNDWKDLAKRDAFGLTDYDWKHVSKMYYDLYQRYQ